MTQTPSTGRPPRSNNDQAILREMLEQGENLPYGTNEFAEWDEACKTFAAKADLRAFYRVAAKLEWWALGGKDGTPAEVAQWTADAADMRAQGEAFREKYLNS